MILSFSSCRTIKTNKTSIKKDSIRENKTFVLVNNSSSFSRIEEPCDENGILRPIFYENTTGGLKTTITDDDGSLLVNQEQKADTIFVDRFIYRDKLDSSDQLTEIPVKNPINTYLLFYSIGLTLWILRKPILKLILPI